MRQDHAFKTLGRMPGIWHYQVGRRSVAIWPPDGVELPFPFKNNRYLIPLRDVAVAGSVTPEALRDLLLRTLAQEQ